MRMFRVVQIQIISVCPFLIKFIAKITKLSFVSQYNVAEILTLCSSGHWVDRKEGLVGLQGLLRSQRQLSASELRKVTDSFTKMFTDPHTKVRFTVFSWDLRNLKYFLFL